MPLSLMLYNPVQHNYVKKTVMFSGLLCTLHTVSKTTEIEERCPIKRRKDKNNNNKKKKKKPLKQLTAIPRAVLVKKR